MNYNRILKATHDQANYPHSSSSFSYTPNILPIVPERSQFERYQIEELEEDQIEQGSDDTQIVFERWSEASHDYPWTLEIKNDSKYPFILSGVSDGSRHPTFLGKTMVGPNGITIGRAKGSDQKDKGYLRIAGGSSEAAASNLWPFDPTQQVTLEITFAFLEKVPTIFQVTIKKNPKRKKIFITIDESSCFESFSIRPQKGTGIINPVSQSGVSLKGNVSSSEIRVRRIQ